MRLVLRDDRGRLLSLVAAGFAASLLVAGCSGETAVPIDPANPPTSLKSRSDSGGAATPDVSHPITATPEMERIARQQCLDDVSADEGYVRAVDPDSGEMMAELTVDCFAVRSGG